MAEDGEGARVVRVEGHGTATALPDRADLRVSVSHLAGDRQAAYATTASRADAVVAVLREAGLADGAWRTSGVRVAAEHEWVDGRRVLTGHRAVAEFTVVVAERLELVDTVVTEVVTRADADVTGPDWLVSPANPARREACALAAVDAQARAGAYAEALGLRLGAVLRIDEVDDAGPGPRPMMAMAMAADGAPAGGTVHAGSIELDARVRVTFALAGGPG